MAREKKLWFKAKNYGWGWQPSSWQGWLLIVVYIIFNVKMFLATDKLPQAENIKAMIFLLPVVCSTAILIIVCYLKGEKPEWRWGRKK